jgi:polysaccharide biosynthesis/export protein
MGVLGALALAPFPGAAVTAPLVAPRTGALQPGPPAPIQLDAYILGPGDVLELRMLDPTAQAFGGALEILNDGTTSLALLGSAQLTGLTISQATQWLSLLYSKVLIRSDLTLRLVRPRPMQVSILGEVDTPGLYSLSPAGDGSAVQGASASVPGLPTVVSAIQKAGGITLNANLRKVTLRRRLPGLAGELKQIELNLAELLQNGNQRQNPFLFDGDTILVSRAENQAPDEVLELGAANLSPQTINVNVIGEVKAPGRLQLRSNTPLTDAILTAGGPNNWRANTNNVQLIRISRNGTASRQVFSVNYSKGVSPDANPPLRDGDTVLVPRSIYGESTDVLNQVVVPLGGLANILNLYYLIDNNNNR